MLASRPIKTDLVWIYVYRAGVYIHVYYIITFHIHLWVCACMHIVYDEVLTLGAVVVTVVVVVVIAAAIAAWNKIWVRQQEWMVMIQLWNGYNRVTSTPGFICLFSFSLIASFSQQFEANGEKTQYTNKRGILLCFCVYMAMRSVCMRCKIIWFFSRLLHTHSILSMCALCSVGFDVCYVHLV